jgi:ATP-binding cassette, subfamily B, bacterial PglK
LIHHWPAEVASANRPNERGTTVTSVRQALTLLGRENRLRWIGLIALALLAGGIEVIGAALVYLLLDLVANPGAPVDLPVVGDVGELIDAERGAVLLGLAVGMGIFFLLRGCVHIFQIYVQNRIGHNTGARLAARLVDGYLRMPYSAHLTRSSSELIRNGNAAVTDLVRQVFIPMIRVVAETILVVAMLAFLILLAPLATALAVVVIGGAAFITLSYVQPRLKRIGRRAHALRRDTLNILQQSLHGIRDVKLLHAEEAFGRRYAKARLALARTEYLKASATDLPKTFLELSLLVFILLVFGIAVATDGSAQGTLSILGLFAYAGLRLQPSLQQIMTGLNNLKFSTAPLEDLHRDLRLTESLPAFHGQVHPLPFQRELTLRDVSFRYETGHRNALAGVSMALRPGEVLGICGPTGGGKTTLIDLVTGLLVPTSGAVMVDGVDMRDVTGRWQANLGVVPQMVFLTDETLRENIALGQRRGEIDEDAVQEAVDLAQLRTFVESLPEGLDTRVGERGVRVSGGQRQRVAIARALYRRPSVLVFDEGTSALDNTTERELMSALARLRGDHTILLVAHRLSTVRDADKIVFLQDGRIAGIGAYEELLESNLAFRDLAVG